jgi:hypothetical protein
MATAKGQQGQQMQSRQQQYQQQLKGSNTSMYGSSSRTGDNNNCSVLNMEAFSDKCFIVFLCHFIILYKKWTSIHPEGPLAMEQQL